MTEQQWYAMIPFTVSVVLTIDYTFLTVNNRFKV